MNLQFSKSDDKILDGEGGGWEKLKEGEQEKNNNSIAEVQTQK